MSSYMPGLTPGAPVSNDRFPVCERCLHRASSHHDPTSCSARKRWGRRCRCTGYTRFDPATPPAPGRHSPADR
jgi:hypothetical protein